MKAEKLKHILIKLRYQEISVKEAEMQVLRLFDVSGNEPNPAYNKKAGEVAVCEHKEEDDLGEDGIYCNTCGIYLRG